ncbi:9299_t:CDS:1, partial [Paraglomus occultum]
SITEFVEWNFDSGRHISMFGLALSSFLKVPKSDVFDALSAILEAYIDPFDDEWKGIPEEPIDVRRFKVERLCPQYRFEDTDGEESELDEDD